MRYQPNRNYNSDDVVMTPQDLAIKLIKHFNPVGRGLEPCRGTGNIYQHLTNCDWCEISEGRDFYEYNSKVDYIFTNPPWSQMRKFLQHSYKLADNVYVLVTVNHLWTKARLKDMRDNNFGVVEICCVHTPKNFPQSGFQLAMIHLKKNFFGKINLCTLED